MTEEEKKAKSKGVRRNLDGDIIGEYSMRQDNTKTRNIDPMEAPEFTEEQKKDLDYYVNGKSDRKYRFNESEMLKKSRAHLFFAERDKTNMPVRERYTKQDGSHRDITIGEASAHNLLQKCVDEQKGNKKFSLSSDELQNTAKKVDPRK